MEQRGIAGCPRPWSLWPAPPPGPAPAEPGQMGHDAAGATHTTTEPAPLPVEVNGDSFAPPTAAEWSLRMESLACLPRTWQSVPKARRHSETAAWSGIRRSGAPCATVSAAPGSLTRTGGCRADIRGSSQEAGGVLLRHRPFPARRFTHLACGETEDGLPLNRRPAADQLRYRFSIPHDDDFFALRGLLQKLRKLRLSFVNVVARHTLSLANPLSPLRLTGKSRRRAPAG